MSNKEKITQSALETFYRQGFNSSSVDQLSQQAGVTKKTLYHHFMNKEDLIKSSLKLRDQQFMKRLEDFLSKLTPQSRPLGYLDFIANWVQESTFNGCFFINASAEFADRNVEPHVIAKDHKDLLVRYLTKICKEAELDKSTVIATQLFLLGEGLTVASQVCGPQKKTIEAAKKLAQTLINQY